ncbi:hypothetical protein LshimejAT787_1501360 [Lyophyllum shimeji]|uniref:Uncharacterized protein n=1 Tax=Lyophyllum shimeji TaxID=47721 RepID=A0A9P3PZ88_LYOSH|nr:hypothetical protein LshimejAT787_1501360 [Lyophyllum shimeji]
MVHLVHSQKLCDDLDHRFPENSMPFFPTGEAWTWASAPPKRTSPPQACPTTDAPDQQSDADSTGDDVPPPPPPPLHRQSTLDDFGYSATTSLQLQHHCHTGPAPSQ